MASGTIPTPYPSDKLGIIVNTFPSGTTDVFTLSNTYRGVIIGLDAGNENKSLLLVSTTSAGTVNVVEVYKGSNITITTSTKNQLTIGHSTASGTYLVFTIRGSITPS